jgi:hypothetical protein
MGKKLILSFICLIIILFSTNLSSISAFNFPSDSTAVTSSSFKYNEEVTLYQMCSNCSYVNITSVTYPSSQVEIINEEMTKNGNDYTYPFTNTSELGIYKYNVCGDKDGGYLCEVLTFEVTYTGKEMSVAQSLLSIGFLGLLILIFIINFVGIGMLPARNQTDEEGRLLSISYLKYFRNILWMSGYFLFIGIVYISSNLAFAFLSETLIANTLFMIFRVSFGLAPVIIIVWLIWIFVSMFHDKEFQKMLNRGIYPGGQL